MRVEVHTTLMSGNLVRRGGTLYVWVGIVRARLRLGSGSSEFLVRSMIVRVSLGNVLGRDAGGAVWRLVSWGSGRACPTRAPLRREAASVSESEEISIISSWAFPYRP